MPVPLPARVRYALGLLAMLIAAAAAAGDVVLSHIEHQAGRYRFSVDMRVQAPAARVYAVLGDYADWHRLNDTIRASDVLRHNAEGVRLRVDMYDCLLIFCRTVRMVQTISRPAEAALAAELIADGSDFRAGHIFWQVTPEGAGARVRVSGWVEPDFWVPPLIGPWALKRMLLRETHETIVGLEARAR